MNNTDIPESSKEDWPRDIIIRPNEQTVKRLMGLGEEDELNDAQLFAWGRDYYGTETIESWRELELEEGFELAIESDREEYSRYLQALRRNP